MNTDIDQVIYKQILNSPQVKVTTLQPDMLLDDIKIDSLEKLDMAMALEAHYSIEISDTEVEQFTSIQDVISYIEAAVEAPADASNSTPQL